VVLHSHIAHIIDEIVVQAAHVVLDTSINDPKEGRGEVKGEHSTPIGLDHTVDKVIEPGGQHLGGVDLVYVERCLGEAGMK